MDAPVDAAASIDAARMKDGMTLWATIDAPWLHLVGADAFHDSLREIRGLGATSVLSSHLPPASDLDLLLELTDGARRAPSFVGPDQAAVEAMMTAEQACA